MKVRISSLGAMVRQAGGPGRPASRTKEMVAQKRRNEDSVMARTARIFPTVMFLGGVLLLPAARGQAPAPPPASPAPPPASPLRRLHPRRQPRQPGPSSANLLASFQLPCPPPMRRPWRGGSPNSSRRSPSPQTSLARCSSRLLDPGLRRQTWSGTSSSTRCSTRRSGGSGPVGSPTIVSTSSTRTSSSVW